MAYYAKKKKYGLVIHRVSHKKALKTICGESTSHMVVTSSKPIAGIPCVRCMRILQKQYTVDTQNTVCYL